MSGRSRRQRCAVNVWPGYVDALSALLMLVIFTLLIFTLAQVFLSETLSSRDKELDQLNARLAEISGLLSLEQEKNERLDQKIDTISTEYTKSLEVQFSLSGQVEQLTATTQADKAEIERQLVQLAALHQDIDTLKAMRRRLEEQVGGLSTILTSKEVEVGALRDWSKSLEKRLADEQERTLLAQQSIDGKEIRISELVNLVRQSDEALKDEKVLSASARAQVAQLNRQISALRDQLNMISSALASAETVNQDQALKLSDMGRRLNLLLAQQVNKLQQYRSEFFGRLREVLGNNPNIRIVGDRFLFQSELLFASGSGDLGVKGRGQLVKLATTLEQLAERIPADINWILQVEGHTDIRPINTPKYPSNWELSTARAVSVVRFLGQQGIPMARLSAAGYGEFHPVDKGQDEVALQANRRIEIKLTDR
ncbi:MAG: peptidoglycan -binding protein [Sedimenticola sp.]